MKTITKFAIFAFMLTLLYSCGGPEGKKVEAEAAKEVKDAPKEAQVFNVRLEESKISWEGTKPTGSHQGTIAIKEGSLNVKDGKIEGGSFIINMNSIVDIDLEDQDYNNKLVNHLKSADFFDSEKFPIGKFEITEVKSVDKQGVEGEKITHTITGNLTLKDITKSISFGANISIGDAKITADAPQFVIDRTIWGVNHMSKTIDASIKDKFIYDDMGIKIHLVAAK